MSCKSFNVQLLQLIVTCNLLAVQEYTMKLAFDGGIIPKTGKMNGKGTQ